MAFVVEFLYGVQLRRRRRTTGDRRERDERDALGGYDGAKAAGKVNA